MNSEIIIFFAILLLTLILFISEKVRMDVIALIVLVTLTVSGLISPQEAISGFSSSAVITIWSMFILSAGLTRTNAAGVLGRSVMNFSGKGESVIIAVIMLISGSLSAFMNNIGVAALMLPVVMSVSRRTDHPPSKLLMPMAFGALLGGFTTLLTTTNLLASEALANAGFRAFGLFDFFPVGIFVFITGVLFVSFIGRKFLPHRDPAKETMGATNIKEQYSLQKRTCIMTINKGGLLHGRTLSETHLGAATGLTVYAIIRNGETKLAPEPSTRLEGGDKLIVGGRLDRLNEFRGWLNLEVQDDDLLIKNFITSEISLASGVLSDDFPYLNQTVHEINFRGKFGVNILAIKRNDEIFRTHISDVKLNAGDKLLLQGKSDALDKIKEADGVEEFKEAMEEELEEVFKVREKTFVVRVPADSKLINQSLSKSRMGGVFGLRVIAIKRNGESIVMPSPVEIIQAGDLLLIEGLRKDLDILHGLQELEIDTDTAPDITKMETEQIGLIEVTFSPRSNIPGKTLRQIHFRGKYGLQVLAVWREGNAVRSNLRDLTLNFGDALLILGSRDKIKLFSHDPDFIVLSGEIKEAPNTKKAPVAALIMAGILTVALLGLVPVSIVAVTGVILMVITGCLSMDEAYKAIDWRSVFLISGMLPIGIAMQKTGAAVMISDFVTGSTSMLGPWGMIIGLYVIITLFATLIPTSAVVVLMSPVMISIAAAKGVSVHFMMMMLAIAASASFLSPVSHPANVLVMGPGGYGFKDYMRVGIPLTFAVMIIALIMLSVFWPL